MWFLCLLRGVLSLFVLFMEWLLFLFNFRNVIFEEILLLLNFCDLLSFDIIFFFEILLFMLCNIFLFFCESFGLIILVGVE